MVSWDISSRRILHLALDAAQAGVWEWDLETGAHCWSEELWNIYGLDPATCEASSEAWQKVIDPHDRERVARALSAAVASNSEFNLEFRVSRNGSLRWLQTRGYPVFDGDGKVRRFAGIALDISQRKRSEEVMLEREGWLQHFADASPVAIAMFDREMRYLAASRRFSADYNLGNQQLIGRSHYDVFPEMPSRWREVHRRCLAGAVEQHPGECFLRADGSEQWIRWEIQPWRFAGGEIGGIVLFSEDITAQKRAEAEIRQLNCELEQRVRDRTAQLEAVNQELEAFAYSVSHDLRAPLRGIEGWSLALAEDYAGRLDEQALTYLDRVRSEARHMSHLIEDMLHLSRVSSSNMDAAQVDLTGIARKIAFQLSEANPGRRIRFEIQTDLCARGDERFLEIALTNLFCNAVKFTATREEAQIEFGATQRCQEPVFHVRDNGAGFDMKRAGALFGAFQRLHHASEFPGSGIGLAIVKRVIHRHGGRVWAEAQPEKGANFYFTIGKREAR